jgi:hypothetical protein
MLSLIIFFKLLNMPCDTNIFMNTSYLKLNNPIIARILSDARSSLDNGNVITGECYNRIDQRQNIHYTQL